MKPKKLSTVFIILSFVSLATGAGFHGLRAQTENPVMFRIGVAAGIAMLVLFSAFLVAGIILKIKEHGNK